MLRKLKFFLIGLVPGLLLVFFILNQKGASCSGYLPESRVIKETLSKDFAYSENFRQQMAALNVSEAFLKDSMLANGGIDFSRSQAQKTPCPEYLLFYPNKHPRFEVHFEKCADAATFNSIKKVR